MSYKWFVLIKVAQIDTRIENIMKKLHISHIDQRSGAPWGPWLCEGGRENSRQSRENFFPGKGTPWGAPWGGPMGGSGTWGLLGEPGPLGERAAALLRSKGTPRRRDLSILR